MKKSLCILIFISVVLLTSCVSERLEFIETGDNIKCIEIDDAENEMEVHYLKSDKNHKLVEVCSIELIESY